MRIGVIDIGYNALRAAAYESGGPGAPELFNNKFKNDTLSLLLNDNLDIKHQTYVSLGYIFRIFKRLKVEHIQCVATAVLRNHPRAEDFVNCIQEKFGIKINVISGEREAYLTALGLISGINDADGIVVDLGGGSLELAEVKGGRVGKVKSLDLGTKVIHAESGESVLDLITSSITQEYGSAKYKNLYLIGGALRFICRVFIEITNYPIRNLHNLKINGPEFQSYLDKVLLNPEISLRQSRRRINTNALSVAQSLLSLFEPESVIVSTYGLKEGIRYEYYGGAVVRHAANNAVKNASDNVLFEKVKYYCKYNDTKTEFSAYYNILRTMLPRHTQAEELTTLAIMLFSLTVNLDKTLPPRALVEYILSAETPFSHEMRIMLALIMFHASGFSPDQYLIGISKKILDKEGRHISQIIGSFLSIVVEIDGPEFISPSFDIEIKHSYLELKTGDILPHTVFEKIRTSLKSIAYARKILKYGEQF